MSLVNGYLFLFFAIILGISSNGLLKTTDSFTNYVPTIFCIISIIACIYCLSKAMTVLPVGFTYASYGGLTITAVTLFGIFKYNQTPNIYGIVGLTLIIIGVKTVQEFLYEITHIFEMSVNDLLIFVLHIVDLALVANLVLILIMSSYSSFVSRIEVAENSIDTPKFLGKVSFKDLKLKVISSIIAISSIGLLEAFVDTSKKDASEIYLMIYIHAIFIVSGLLLALMDYFSIKSESEE